MKKKKYVSPELTVVSFRTEVGYAASGMVPNVAEQINTTFELGNAQFETGFTGEGQVVGGQSVDSTGNNGLAAGYFYEESTTGWFN